VTHTCSIHLVLWQEMNSRSANLFERMIDLLVIADDMTGAIEVGAFFAGRGVGALVSAKPEIVPAEVRGDVAVLVVDTESRHISAAEAAGGVQRLATHAGKEGIRYIYKKTDSTLRGNIGSELNALLSAFPEEPLVYVPAYPKMGRTCKGGRLYVEGRPLEEGVFANDPLHPAVESSIPKILANQCRAAIVPAADARALQEALLNARQEAIYLCDGVSDADLLEVARVLQNLDRLHLTAGPGGFAEFLAEILELPRGALPPRPPVRSTLTVCGSANEISLAQVRYAEEHGFAAFKLSPEHVLREDFFESDASKATIRQILDLLASHGHLVIKIITSRGELPAYFEYAASLGISKSEAHGLIMRQLGFLVRRVIDESSVDGLIVFGGDTAAGILQEADIWPVGELLPAVPVSRVILNGRELCLVTKPGGFGPVEVLLSIERLLNS